MAGSSPACDRSCVTRAFRAQRSGTISWTARGSAMICPTVMRGFNELYGSWKITCIRRRTFLSSFSLKAVISCPSKMIWPLVGFSSWRMQRPVVVLPQPDSPTRPSVSPRRIEKLTPSTALTTAGLPPRRPPPPIGKCLTRSRTSRIVSLTLDPLSYPLASARFALSRFTWLVSPSAAPRPAWLRLARLAHAVLPSCPATQQAERWSGATASSGGCSSRQRSMA